MLTNIVRRMLSVGALLGVVAVMTLSFATARVRATTLTQAANTVQIQNFTFEPVSLTVPAGATVTWVNNDSAPHTATARDGSFDTSQMAQGESKTVTLNTAGTFEYYCLVHPRMVATLTVGAAQQQAAAAPATMPNTGISSGSSELLAMLGLLALLAGSTVAVALRRRSS